LGILINKSTVFSPGEGATQAPGKSSRGLRAEGRENKDARLRREYQVTSPFLGGRGSLCWLCQERGRRKPRE